MNVLSILGSPKKKGNTAILLEYYLRGIKDNQDNVIINCVFLQEKNIEPCRGCYTCVNTGNNCVIQDDMQNLYDLIKETDVLIFATPVYWWSVTSQLKKFIDRLCPISPKNLKGKKFVLLMTYGSAPPNPGPGMVKDMIREICNYFEMDFVQSYSTCTEECLPVAKNKDAQMDAYNLGKDLIMNFV